VTRRRLLWPLAGALAAGAVFGSLAAAGALGGAPMLARGTDLGIRSVAFEPGTIAIRVANEQAGSFQTVAVVTVDDAIVPFGPAAAKTLVPGGSATVDVPFDWVAGDPYKVAVTNASGLETTAEITAPARG
jgi:hypothetical protein